MRVVLFVGTFLWALVTDEPWWSVIISPFISFVLGLFASLALVAVGFLLQSYVPFWRRSFWRGSGSG